MNKEQSDSASDSDTTSSALDRDGLLQGLGVTARSHFAKTYEEALKDLQDEAEAYLKKAVEEDVPWDYEDGDHFIGRKLGDFFEEKFRDDPQMSDLVKIYRKLNDQAHPPVGVKVTRVPPSDRDFIGPPGEKLPQPAGTTTWGSKPGTTTPAGTTTGGTAPGGTTPVSTEKGGMREGRTPTESDSTPAAPESFSPSGEQETSGGGSQEFPNEEPPGGGSDQPGDEPGGGEQPGEAPGGGGQPGKVEFEEPSDDEIEINGSFESGVFGGRDAGAPPVR